MTITDLVLQILNALLSAQGLFYLFSAIAIFAGTLVVFLRQSVYAVLALVLAFFACAGLWILLHAEFLGLILILVYVGAVMTLFLFVVMMLNMRMTGFRKGLMPYFPIGILLVLMILALIVLAIGPAHFGLSYVPMPAPKEAHFNDAAALGELLYTRFVYPFEIASVLLLAAIVAAIVLSYRGPKQRRSQIISEQVAVKREDRVQLISMPSDSKSSKGNLP